MNAYPYFSFAGRALTGMLLAGAIGLAACGSSGTGGAPTSGSPAASQSAVPSASASAPSVTPSSSTAALIKPAPKGYTYTTVPGEFSTLTSTMLKTGMVTAGEAQGVNDSSGSLVAVIVAFQYNPALTESLDKAATDTVLDGAVKGVKAFVPGEVTTVDASYNGTVARMISSKDMTVAVAYERGGRLIEVFGPDKKSLDEFLTAYYLS